MHTVATFVSKSWQPAVNKMLLKRHCLWNKCSAIMCCHSAVPLTHHLNTDFINSYDDDDDDDNNINNSNNSNDIQN